jgi:hypothetical protein
MADKTSISRTQPEGAASAPQPAAEDRGHPLPGGERGSRVLVLAPADNVGVAIKDLAAGEVVIVDSRPITCVDAVALGHKIALTAIAAGQKIIKFGAPIGSATRDIGPGEHVHTHNMKSDYLPPFGRDGSSRMSQ